MSNDGKRQPLRISVDEAKEMYDDEEVTALDVVDPSTYEELSYRIEKAVRIDPRDFKDEYERLPQDRTVLAYCT